jgi:hypothetical protein
MGRLIPSLRQCGWRPQAQVCKLWRRLSSATSLVVHHTNHKIGPSDWPGLTNRHALKLCDMPQTLPTSSTVACTAATRLHSARVAVVRIGRPVVRRLPGAARRAASRRWASRARTACPGRAQPRDTGAPFGNAGRRAGRRRHARARRHTPAAGAPGAVSSANAQTDSQTHCRERAGAYGGRSCALLTARLRLSCELEPLLCGSGRRRPSSAQKRGGARALPEGREAQTACA